MGAEQRRRHVSPGSVYLAVRRHDPTIPVVRLRKRTLAALSHALEDEIELRCLHPVLFGGFQHEDFLRDPLPRWQELARTARACVVFAATTSHDPTEPVRLVELTGNAPLRQEWAVVADDEAFGVVLSAWEIPGQDDIQDRDRSFELVWSVESGPIRRAARVCAAMALAGGLPDADRLLTTLEETPTAEVGPRAVTEVVARILTYVDAGGRSVI
ncbi:DICT sensory domain-containing protein [Nocardioides mangrovi]|uniref:DICT domain-containing protein n=1 Tax=Nocardioides mangrovi TaxID=2874580 RepID=A0ABS7U9Y3_9ACTN|nr:DICT sensory domain-containing protein [Nocardioides mangrovi]MBZ5737677.1 hypothetical protein [Nocardioides mangrovi]